MIETRERQNTTGSMWRKHYDNGLTGITLLYSYNTVVGYIRGYAPIDDNMNLFCGKDNVVLIDSGYYSATTNKHQSSYREEFGVERADTFDYKAFLKRAERDGVDVKGGWNN